MHHAGPGFADLEFAGLWCEQNMFRRYTAQASASLAGRAEYRQQELPQEAPTVLTCLENAYW